MKVGFVTFGCRLNRAETLDLEAQYAAAGWEIVPVSHSTPHHSHLTPQPFTPSTSPSPDLIIVRGCSVTAKAQRDCEKAIDHLRSQFPFADIRITGCLAQRRYAPVERCGLSGTTHLLNVESKALSEEVPPPPSTLNSQLSTLNYPLSRAYLKVQDGCSGKCAFCIVPTFRGTPVSVPFDNVLIRARAFLAAGFRELVVTGCNLCLYRDSGRGLPELVAALAALESPGHRVRLGSIEPGICDERLVDALEAHPNICRFLHLALQSGSDRILRLMHRPYTMERIAAFCADACRRLGPRLAFGADIITGFPGETEADHAATLQFLTYSTQTPKHIQSSTLAPRPSTFPPSFIHLHVFPYSERPGTAAATMKPVVPVAIRRARAKDLERIGAASRAAYAQNLIGQTVVVCVEKDGNGRTDGYLRCLLKGTAPRRSLVRAKVKDYFPKTGALSATICAKEQEGGTQS